MKDGCTGLTDAEEVVWNRQDSIDVSPISERRTNVLVSSVAAGPSPQ